MAFNESDWMSDLSQIQSTLRSLRVSPSPPGQKQLDNVTRALERLEVRWTEVKSDPASFGLSPAEVARRTTLLQGVSSQVRSLQSRRSPPSAASDPTEDALQATTQTVMEVQDGMIDELSSGVSRLADQARMINEEANLHTNLLDDMETDVEAATVGLRAEARHAEKIREESSTCKLYLIIVGLSALLVFLIIMGFSK